MGPVSQPFPVPFPDPSPVRRLYQYPGPVCQSSLVSYPGPSPVLGLSTPMGPVCHPVPVSSTVWGPHQYTDQSTTHSRLRAPASCSGSWDTSFVVRSSLARVSSGARLHLEVRAVAHLQLSSSGASHPCAVLQLGVLFRFKQYFNSAQLLKLYTDFIRPCLEYCSHVWGSSPYTSLLDGVESKAIRLIGDPSLTSVLDPLSLRRKVASLSLFYRYYFGHCCDELATCIPRPMAQPRSTWQASFAHNYCVELSNARINRFSEMIVMVSSLLLPAFGTLSLLLYFRLPSTFRPSKGRSSTTLGTRWHDFFFYPF